MKIVNSIVDLIGNTPMVELKKYADNHQVPARLIAKLEEYNPAGSAKDRIALQMVLDAEAAGLLKPGATIIEPTSGNTGVGLAFVAATRGYKAIFTMPETMSMERRTLLRAYGAQVVLTSAEKGMKGSIDKAEELNREIEGSIILGQFDNPSNPKAHYLTTAEEIWKDTDGQVDVVVAGVGTGGTICGIGKRLKELKPEVKIIAIEPYSSQVIAGKPAGPHKLQGLGANFVPKTFNIDNVDEVFPVKDDDAIRCARQLPQEEGLLVGISSGAALYAACEVAKRPENKGKNIVVILPDTGERYLSTLLYAFDEYPL
ncbi:MAG: cysteine synthase A [Paludibacteraceae bacterium]|nr:cysteine synthase A [Paludibacteraceae bacterium]